MVGWHRPSPPQGWGLKPPMGCKRAAQVYAHSRSQQARAARPRGKTSRACMHAPCSAPAAHRDVLGGVARDGQHDEAQEGLVYAAGLAHSLDRAREVLCTLVGLSLRWGCVVVVVVVVLGVARRGHSGTTLAGPSASRCCRAWRAAACQGESAPALSTPSAHHPTPQPACSPRLAPPRRARPPEQTATIRVMPRRQARAPLRLSAGTSSDSSPCTPPRRVQRRQQCQGDAWRDGPATDPGTRARGAGRQAAPFVCIAFCAAVLCPHAPSPDRDRTTRPGALPWLRCAAAIPTAK